MIEQLDKQLKQLLQDNIEFRSRNNNKCLRKGTLQLYSIKDFYITVILRTSKGDTKNFHMPFPFKFSLTKSKLSFDYTLDVIHSGRSAIIDNLDNIGTSKSPFYDNVIELRRVNR